LIVELARNFRQNPVPLAGIAQEQSISVKYLEQIIRPLKKAGYLTSVRGPKGGHMLTKDPQDISVGEIVALLEDGDQLIQCADNPHQCRRAANCATRFVWQEAARAMYDRINEITFSSLLKLSDELSNEGVNFDSRGRDKT
jgi:Rrf2 family protein